MSARRINALDIQMPDARRAMCAGFWMRTFFGFFTRMPHFVAPGIDQFSKQALKPDGGGDEESDSSMPPVKEGGSADEWSQPGRTNPD